mgnify:CR=1 FL=1
MRRSTKRLAAAILIAALGILSACGTSAAPETTPLPTSEPTAKPESEMTMAPAGMTMGRRPIRDMSDHHT